MASGLEKSTSILEPSASRSSVGAAVTGGWVTPGSVAAAVGTGVATGACVLWQADARVTARHSVGGQRVGDSRQGGRA